MRGKDSRYRRCLHVQVSLAQGAEGAEGHRAEATLGVLRAYLLARWQDR